MRIIIPVLRFEKMFMLLLTKITIGTDEGQGTP